MENLSCAENNYGQVDLHGGRHSSEFQETVEIVTLEEFSRLLGCQPKELHPGSWRCRRRQIQKVPPHVRRRNQHSEQVYDPMMVSLGPYHHGTPELHRAEEFKYLCLDWCARGDEKKKVFFYNKIIEKIEVIRDCYAEDTIVKKYDDKALALMMLLDACIIINFMHNSLYTIRNNDLDWQNFLGAGSSPFMIRDMMVLENQIPLQVLELLLSLQYEEEEEAEGFLERFLSLLKIDLNPIKIPRNGEPPTHFLEAFWRVLENINNSQPNPRVHNELVSKFGWPRFLKSREKNNTTNVSYAHRSVMDLKAKGIFFRPNASLSLRDITFTSHAIYGQLQLPAYIISDLSPVFVSNLIAYEVSPNNNITPVVLSHAILMKSLIQCVEDAKELQEKGILLNRFANLEKVVKFYKEIDTLGIQDEDVFLDIKQKIGKHCNSKAKTWIADLIHTRFQTPWTAIALFAAACLLCLTFLQTFFTIHQNVSSRN